MQQNLFQRDEIAELMVATLLKYRDAGEFELHEYVVMPNHIHLLLSLSDQQQLGRAIQLIKGGFSHSLREQGIVFRAVWEQRYHDRRVRDVNEFAEFSAYIRQNPVRKGLVEHPQEYPYSSAGERAGVPGLKPLKSKNGDVDANLKVRSTGPSEMKDRQNPAKPLGNKNEHLDANLKVRSTDPSEMKDRQNPVKPLGNKNGDLDANLTVRSTGPSGMPDQVFGDAGEADLKVRSAERELNKCTTIFFR